MSHRPIHRLRRRPARALACVALILGVSVLCTPSSAQTTKPGGAQGAPPPPAAPTPDKVFVKMTTTAGNLVLELYPKKAPITVKNFLAYVDEGFYKGLIFHRVMADFMVQGGGFTEKNTMSPKKPTHPPIKNEATNGLKNEFGTIAMARTGVVDSATSQFFINVKDNPFLNHRSKKPREYGYCVFGRLVHGFDALEKIRTAKTKMHPAFRAAVLPEVPIVIQDTVRMTPKAVEKLLKETPDKRAPKAPKGVGGGR